MLPASTGPINLQFQICFWTNFFWQDYPLRIPGFPPPKIIVIYHTKDVRGIPRPKSTPLPLLLSLFVCESGTWIVRFGASPCPVQGTSTQDSDAWNTRKASPKLHVWTCLGGWGGLFWDLDVTRSWLLQHYWYKARFTYFETWSVRCFTTPMILPKSDPMKCLAKRLNGSRGAGNSI